ncbi:MAG: M56 family metallopeptidase [Blautia sp.]|nr:M56 family metallopeptidase [Blautia sp.]
MEEMFLEAVWVSLVCGLGIVLVFAVSPLLRKRNTVFWRYCLWMLFAARLVLPFNLSLPGRAVVLPFPVWEEAKEAETGVLPEDWPGNAFGEDRGEDFGTRERGREENISMADFLGETTDVKNENGRMEQEENKAAIPVEENSTAGKANNQNDVMKNMKAVTTDRVVEWAAAVWAAAVIVLLVWQLVCYAVFCRKIKRTRVFFALKENLPVYTSSAVSSPMLAGIWRPQILLPDYFCTQCEQEQLDFILEHEYTHYKRKDLLVKMLLSLAWTIHWFNPLVFWMMRQAAQDMELLCDSRVTKGFSREEKRLYGETLLGCASAEKRRTVIFCTSEFSKDARSLKVRFANLFSQEGKRKGIFAAVLGGILLAVISLFAAFGTSERDTGKPAAVSGKPGAGEDYGEDTQKEALSGMAVSENMLEEKRSLLLGFSPGLIAEAEYGAVFPRLVYASDKRAVLYDYWGLLVYDIGNQRIEQILDLKAVDLNHMQGERVTHVEVSADGAQILLYNEPDTKERFVYYIDDKRLEYSDLDSFAENHYDGLLEREGQAYAITESGAEVSLSADSLLTADGDTYHPEDVQGLSLIVSGPDWGECEVCPLFVEYFEGQQEVLFPHLDWSDFGRVTGKKFLHEDEDGWRYYLEEDEGRESELWEIGAPFEPLLLTRYQDGQRQVLEDLIYQEAYQECPMLFVAGRIVYKAAKTADVAAIKSPSLVSISADGSDRRIADDIPYGVFDNICEDGGWLYYLGWSNDGRLPRPLCRISPDFSSGSQPAGELPGYLCGVMDGYVYYFAGTQKEPGIWKKNLATGKEQLYDKWGLAAEDILFFRSREQTFLSGTLHDTETPGCRILFQTDYDKGICSNQVGFR